MLYQLEVGGTEQNILRRTLPHEQLPDRISNAPQIENHLLFYWDAFLELDTERNLSMGITQIPWSSIYSYAKVYKMDGEEFEFLLHHMRAMDLVKLEFLRKKWAKK